MYIIMKEYNKSQPIKRQGFFCHSIHLKFGFIFTPKSLNFRPEITDNKTTRFFSQGERCPIGIKRTVTEREGDEGTKSITF